MVASAPVRPLVPLVLEELPLPSRRGGRVILAPDVTGVAGAEAVALARARGFIAAIEPVPSELPEGTVIEQEPAPGASRGREAILTLRLAARRLELGPARGDDTGEVAREIRAVDDDTDQWFAAMATAHRIRPCKPRRRRRKHRAAASTRRGLHTSDAPPAPDAPRSARPDARPVRDPHLSALIVCRASALCSALAGAPARRAAALLAVVLVFALVGARLLSPGARRPLLDDGRVPLRIADAQLARGQVDRIAPRVRRAIHPRRPRTAQQRSLAQDAALRVTASGASPSSPPSAVRASAPVVAEAGSPSAAPPGAESQFAYLGR